MDAKIAILAMGVKLGKVSKVQALSALSIKQKKEFMDMLNSKKMFGQSMWKGGIAPSEGELSVEDLMAFVPSESVRNSFLRGPNQEPLNKPSKAPYNQGPQPDAVLDDPLVRKSMEARGFVNIGGDYAHIDHDPLDQDSGRFDHWSAGEHKAAAIKFSREADKLDAARDKVKTQNGGSDYHKTNAALAEHDSDKLNDSDSYRAAARKHRVAAKIKGLSKSGDNKMEDVLVKACKSCSSAKHEKGFEDTVPGEKLEKTKDILVEKSWPFNAEKRTVNAANASMKKQAKEGSLNDQNRGDYDRIISAASKGPKDRPPMSKGYKEAIALLKGEPIDYAKDILVEKSSEAYWRGQGDQAKASPVKGNRHVANTAAKIAAETWGEDHPTTLAMKEKAEGLMADHKEAKSMPAKRGFFSRSIEANAEAQRLGTISSLTPAQGMSKSVNDSINLRFQDDRVEQERFAKARQEYYNSGVNWHEDDLLK